MSHMETVLPDLLEVLRSIPDAAESLLSAKTRDMEDSSRGQSKIRNRKYKLVVTSQVILVLAILLIAAVPFRWLFCSGPCERILDEGVTPNRRRLTGEVERIVQ